MQLGRKKRRENLQQEESENSNDLSKNKHLLEYQNKCLGTKIEALKNTLNEKSNYANLLEKRISTFAEVFLEFNLGLFNLSQQLKNIIPTINTNFKTNTIDSLNISRPIKILSSIINDINESSQNKPSEALNEQLKSIIDSTGGIITEMINNIIKAISYENELKEIIEKKIDELDDDKVFEGLSRENKNLKTKNEELLGLIEESFKKEKKIRLKKIQLKAELKIIEEKIKVQSQEITELKNKNISLMRKVNTNPALPYINFEKLYFPKIIESHQCICHICGNEINTSGACGNINSAEDKENILMKDEDDVKNRNKEDLIALTCENENLKARITELIESNEKIKMENVITENKIISSKVFKSLYNQSESLFLKIEEIKEINSDLQKQKFELIQEKENEIKNQEKKFYETKNKLEQQIFDLNKQNESNLLKIQDQKLNLEMAENLLKAKNSNEIELIFQKLNQEKQKWEKQFELIKQHKKEYSKKYDEEYSKNSSNEKLIIKLNAEIEKLRQNLSRYENPDKEEKYEKFDAKERDKMKRDLRRQEDKINLYEKNLKDLKIEIQLEKENGEKYIAEIEVNEKGIDDLKKELKSLMIQLQEKEEKIAKITNEKVKDMNTIKLLNEEKRNLDNIIENQENINKTNIEYTKKLETNLNLYKESITKLEQELKLKEEEMASVTKESKQISKVSEQNRIAYEETLKALKDSQETSSKSSANYEQMKAKYEELCKMKKLDSSIIGNSFEEITAENEVLKLENEKYKKMVKCKVCFTNNKDVILLKCFHLFCKECIEGTIKSRNRICPACRDNISTSDIHSIFLD